MTATIAPDTAAILAAMLKENTGIHMLDSGGSQLADGTFQHGYGRNWQRNQAREFEAEPTTVLSVDAHDISVTHNLYHWLKERLSFDSASQERFEAYRAEEDPEDEAPELIPMEGFAHWLRERGHEVTGLYGDGEPMTVNTYNGEDLLSQTIQYVYMEIGGEPLVLLQIHGGCDVRGGYTLAKCFRARDDGAYMLNNADAAIRCKRDAAPPDTSIKPLPLEVEKPPREDHYWSTDDAYHWYSQGACGCGAGQQLEDYERREITDPDEWEKGVLCYFGDGRALCPLCGGSLVASF